MVDRVCGVFFLVFNICNCDFWYVVCFIFVLLDGDGWRCCILFDEKLHFGDMMVVFLLSVGLIFVGVCVFGREVVFSMRASVYEVNCGLGVNFSVSANPCRA